MKKVVLILLITLICFQTGYSQQENLPVGHPVYTFLKRAETAGMLPHFTMSSLPLSREQIISALNDIQSNRSELSQSEQSVLDLYLTEFEIKNRNNAVVIYSATDSVQVFSSRFISDDEKFIYRYKDSSNSIEISPLASVDMIYNATDKKNATIGQLGFRMHGDISKYLGYSLQATNGRLINGNRDLVLMDLRYGKSIKFKKLKDDIDLTESHINFKWNWLYLGIGRETRLEGAGLKQRLFVSENAPAFDALTAGARFGGFEYKFMHASLLGIAETGNDVGFNSYIPEKYMAFHKFSLRPSWGEIAFIEQVVYSGRQTDLAYWNPLSFLKSLEHALRDRDNSLMGLSAVVRPVKGVQISASYLLDDIIFEKIGQDFWSNKSAWNFGVNTSFIKNIDLGAEYSRIEPYTFSHFNIRNSVTNDGLRLGSDAPPNSETFFVSANIWTGTRYPIHLALSLLRHGENIYEGDSLVVNAGGSATQTRRSYDPMTVKFLGGNLKEILSFEIGYGMELFRGFNIQALYTIRNEDDKMRNYGRIILRFDDF